MTATMVVQGLWVEGELSAMEALAVRSFLAQGHEVHVYSYERDLALPAGARRMDAAAVLPASAIFRYTAGPGAGSLAAFSNLFRYKLLHERGGWWTDLDMVCLRPLDFAAEHVFASERRKLGGVTVTNSLLKTPAGSPLTAELYERALRHEQRATVWGSTGPALVREVVERHGAERFMVPPDVFCPVDWWQAETLRQPGEIPDGAHALHLWHEKWRSNGWPKDPGYPPAVLYQRLHRRYPAPDERRQ